MVPVAEVKVCRSCGVAKDDYDVDRYSRLPKLDCRQCERVRPPGILGPCPDCASPVLLWATATGEPITILDSTPIVGWVSDIAIGPTLRSMWPVHHCEQTAELTKHQRGAIHCLWARGEITIRDLMKHVRPQAGQTWPEAKRAILALAPEWIEITPIGRTIALRYTGPARRRLGPESEYQSQNNKQETE